MQTRQKLLKTTLRSFSEVAHYDNTQINFLSPLDNTLVNSPFRFVYLYLFNYPEFKEVRDKELIASYTDRNVRYATDKKAIEENIIYLGRQLRWDLIEDGSTSRIYREFSFSNKDEVLDFITLIAPKCDELDHHPEWLKVN